jgi:hypothetical protein
MIWGLFQLLGQGTGSTLYRFVRRSISLRKSVFFGRNKLFGSRDHGLLSNESKGVSLFLTFKPIQQIRNNVFYRFLSPHRFVDTDKTLPLSTTRLNQSMILHLKRCHWRLCLPLVAEQHLQRRTAPPTFILMMCALCGLMCVLHVCEDLASGDNAAKNRRT